MPTKKRQAFIKLIKNKCRCGATADCLVRGFKISCSKGDEYEKIIGVDCKACGFQMKATDNDIACMTYPHTDEKQRSMKL